MMSSPTPAVFSSSSPSIVLVDHYIHNPSSSTAHHTVTVCDSQPAMESHRLLEEKQHQLAQHTTTYLASASGSTTAKRSLLKLEAAPVLLGEVETKVGQQKKPKILHHQPAPLAPRLIAPLQARPRFAATSSFATTSTASTMSSSKFVAVVKDIVETSVANHRSNHKNKSILRMIMPQPMLPMPHNMTPHEIAREAMRITQEAMKKQKLQDDQSSLQKQQPQQTTSSSSSSGSTSSTSSLQLLNLQPSSSSSSPHPPCLSLQQQRSEGPKEALPCSATTTSTQTTGAIPTPRSSSSSSSTRLLPTMTTTAITTTTTGHPVHVPRLNKFVRRLHDMLRAEKNGGIVEWRRRGLLVLHNTHLFAKTILPKWFGTRNFKTFRRQLNYYGFVHVRSFSNATTTTDTDQTSTSTTALWVHQELAAQHQQQQQLSSSSCSSSSQGGSSAENHCHIDNADNADDDDDDDIAAVLQLRRVEACDAAIPKTAEDRRHRKEQAIYTVEEDLGVNAKTLQMEHIQSLLLVRGSTGGATIATTTTTMTACGGADVSPSKTNATAVVPMTTCETFTRKALENAARFQKHKDETALAAAGAAGTLQRTQQPPLLPALTVPWKISVPRSGCGSAAFAAAAAATLADQETAQGAATLLLMLSKAV